MGPRRQGSHWLRSAGRQGARCTEDKLQAICHGWERIARQAGKTKRRSTSGESRPACKHGKRVTHWTGTNRAKGKASPHIRGTRCNLMGVWSTSGTWTTAR